MNSYQNSRPAWAEIDMEALAHNIKELRRITSPQAKFMAVVKANGYGHGAVQVSQTALANGADCLAVAILNEARHLRAAGIKAPILILGFTPNEQADDLVNLDITQAVYNFEGAEAISKAAVKLGKKAKIHIKADTGMGRIGFKADSSSVPEILKIASLPGIEIEGLFTHFSVADERDKEYTYFQFNKFQNYYDLLNKSGVHIPIRHASNSAALIDLPEMHLDMVRAGISIYGLYPSQEVMKDKIELKPAMSFKARVAYVKTLPAGSSVSYGRRYIAQSEIRVATVPVGYADGYSRLLTNKVHVLINGKRVPAIGTICMDQFMVDVTSLPEVKQGDEVVLIGRQGDQEITADEIAQLIGTISYEIVCGINARVPRVYV